MAIWKVLLVVCIAWQAATVADGEFQVQRTNNNNGWLKYCGDSDVCIMMCSSDVIDS